jgi:hypothetical protein
MGEYIIKMSKSGLTGAKAGKRFSNLNQKRI